MSNQIIIQSKNYPILLRLPKISDTESLHYLLGDERNTEFDPFTNSDATLDQTKVWIERMRQNAFLEKPKSLNLVLVKDDKVIGLTGFGYIGEENGQRIGDIGIMIDTDYRYKGYATEALRLSLNYGWNILKLDAITSTMLEKNIPMKNLLEKKFNLKGLSRESEFGKELYFVFFENKPLHSLES